MTALPLAFTVPAVLAALLLLPALYYLLRVTPPRPDTIPFPPLRLILDLAPKQEVPARTPWWLLLLRLGLAAALILAMAGPIWNPAPGLDGDGGPVVVILDDGLAAAPDWDRRIANAAERIEAAARAGRPTALLPISAGERAIEPTTGAQTLERLRALAPQPIVPDRLPALTALATFAAKTPHPTIVWISDGLENGNAAAFAKGVERIAGGSATVVSGDGDLVGLTAIENRSDALDIRLVRADGSTDPHGHVRAFDRKGAPLGDAVYDFGSATTTEARLDLPVELRNQISRVAVDGVRSAGAVGLLDSRDQRRRVGLSSGTTADLAQPLLSPTFYLARALAPFADVRQANGTVDPIATLLDQDPSVMILADVNIGPGVDHDRLAEFVEHGGTLVRFAGARLAGAADDLVPVTLRRGGRTFGGALSWDQPKTLAAFDEASPFAGLRPHDNVTVTRQVLAEPEPGLRDKTWAQLSDGTPLVTAETRGKGTLVLFHVTADTTWSNLPLSGLFVDMLRRLLDRSILTSGHPTTPGAGPVESTATTLPPVRVLDGFGELGSPPLTARPISPVSDTRPTFDHPPGFYGPPEAEAALNALAPDAVLMPATLPGTSLRQESFSASSPIDLRGPLLLFAACLYLLDTVLTLWLGGRLTWRRRFAPAAVAGLLGALCLLGTAQDGKAQSSPAAPAPPAVSAQEMASALSVRLAFVVSGDATVDATSQQGLAALSHALADRTSLTPGDPIGVDPSRDELSFYPILYWPIVASASKPSAEAIGRIASYMKQGGTIVFDTRDALQSRPGMTTPEGTWLRDLLSGVDVPEVEPLPRDHVVTRTFYILSGFVGRYATAPTWIEALPPVSPDEANRPARAGDSVSPIVITGNDLAAAWAEGRDGQPLYPLVPGGPRQRELALRGGINLVMYTLTGNYKADQVHVRDLLERLAR